MEWITKL